MVRIEGALLPATKRVEYGLTYVMGIGLKSSRDILKKLDINFDTRVKDLTDAQIAAIQNEITDNYLIEGERRKQIQLDIARLKEIGSYRGLRHKKGLPVHGQRTKTNARSRKGPRKAPIAKKKTATKK